jgi:predicted murein hydrolase (TIGR00659 family)
VTGDLAQIWVYLSTSPLLGLAATLVAYQASIWIYEKAGRPAILNPIPLAIAIIVGFLLATGTDYRTYFDGAQFVHFLLGPATVALAVPLYNQLPLLLRVWPAVLAVVLTGALVAAASAVGIVWALGGSDRIMLSLAPKSVTIPIAMGVSERIGGIPSLTAVMVMLTGLFGAMVGGWILDRAKVTDPAARGLALGISAHGVGTVRAFQENETAGAFAGMAIGLTGLVTAILVPILIGLIR